MRYWDRSWNPVSGCLECSEACKNCYSRIMVEKKRLKDKNASFDFHINETQYSRNFDNSHELMFVVPQGDLFFPTINSKKIVDHILTHSTTFVNKHFLCLTMRANAMADYFSKSDIADRIDMDKYMFGVTVESPKHYDRIDTLIGIPQIKHRFIALEPILERMDIEPYILSGKIDWVVVGAENGEERRPCKLEWIERVIVDCHKHRVPVFVQNVNVNGRIVSDYNNLPIRVRCRQWHGDFFAHDSK